MASETETLYLMKAVQAFKRRLMVVSPDLKILALNRPADVEGTEAAVGGYCYRALYHRNEPCLTCPVLQCRESGRPAMEFPPGDYSESNDMPCLFAYPIFSGESLEAVVTLDFDLPARWMMEDRAQKTNAFLRNLILSSVDGVIAADKKGRILIYNDMAAELFGYTVEEAMERLNIRDLYPDHKEYEVMKALRSDDYGGRGKLRSYEVEVLHKSGERIPINLNASIVYEGDREVATIGFFRDQRGLNRMKAELEKTQLQLLQSEKMASLGKLAAGVAHQLNNPLSGITLFTKLVLEEYRLEEGARQDLQRVMEDAERCRDTVKELLEFARQTKHVLRPHDVNRAISRTLFLLENQTLFQNIIIEKDLDPTLPSVESDIQQLNHLFMNIILNAAQAMSGNGRLIIRTRYFPEKDQVRIEISDTGPGIPEDILPHIFDPFFTTKQEGEGTGLGLSLVYGIVQNQGGEIRALNRPEGGASFIIDLPITPKEKGGK